MWYDEDDIRKLLRWRHDLERLGCDIVSTGDKWWVTFPEPIRRKYGLPREQCVNGSSLHEVMLEMLIRCIEIVQKNCKD